MMRTDLRSKDVCFILSSWSCTLTGEGLTSQGPCSRKGLSFCVSAWRPMLCLSYSCSWLWQFIPNICRETCILVYIHSHRILVMANIYYNVSSHYLIYFSKQSMQRSPTFWAPGTGFVEDNFSTDLGGVMVSRWFKHPTFIVHFISITITSAPPQIIRH